MKTRYRVTFDLDVVQLGVLVSTIEGMFNCAENPRNLAWLKGAIERCADRWAPDSEAASFHYELLVIAPIYRQLMEICLQCGEPEPATYDAENIYDFVGRLREARKACDVSTADFRRT